MKTTKRTLCGLLSLALVLLLALTAAVPAFAANSPANTENLRITIHNNEGLPAMTANQFNVYQLFKGTPKEETNPDAGTAEWDATNWNNYILADIEWGASISDKTAQDNLIKALKELDPTKIAWLEDTALNPFQNVESAADVAAVLVEKDNEFMQGFVDFLMKGKYLTPVTAPGTVEENSKDTTADDTLTYDLSKVGTGYYIFEDTNATKEGGVSAVSEYIVAVMGSQDIDMKASVPSVDKWIDAAGDKKGTTADIGEDIKFVLQGTLAKNYNDYATYTYIFHDTLSEGLTYLANPAPLIEISDNSGKKFTVNAADYVVRTTGITDAPCNLEFVFNDLKTLENSTVPGDFVWNELTKVTVTYYAELNEKAVVGNGTDSDPGNHNKVHLEYSNDPHDSTTYTTGDKEVWVYTFGFQLKKVGTGTGDTDGLSGAGFMLKDAAQANYAKFKDVDGTKVFDGWVSAATVEDLIAKYTAAKTAYDNATNDEKGNMETGVGKALQDAIDAMNVYLLKSVADGTIPNVAGLDAGTYYLREVITPEGYNTMADFKVEIEATVPAEKGSLDQFVYTPNDGTPVTYNSGAVYQSGLIPQTLTNQKAPFLPFTGGMGTLIFYVLGAALIGGAVAYLVIASRKRKNTEEKA